ncbi:MAG: hypothetical protein RI895_559 [Actinomycetota bacterium]
MGLAGFLAGDAPVAQWIEHQVSTLSVGGSSPLGRTTGSEIYFCR